MSFREVEFKSDGSYVISDDPDNVLYTFISAVIYDLTREDSGEVLDFMKSFEPMGEGYSVYELGGASRVTYAPTPDDPEPQAEDEWKVSVDWPYKSIFISGDELRHLFRQVITGLLPRHPELAAVYDT
ncbi:hypothetical protein [Deinococcus multiflagellatus]|uniref:Uncharacterized protein n=1 Tax=Deinococcus multiflagellatus TaxID=1656887 RepID=A0ABW1ZHQ9_9DEIO|nr:hypothetical protein [Deinococcus multiflagellatus]MBZ9713021.1 hypothetical protein [Deinococcus multiflagellatus]